MNDNLSNRIWCAKNGANDLPNALTDQQKADILSMVGAKCRQTTKAKLARRLELPLSLWENFGIFTRITLTDNEANYICGQSWHDEMRTLRECIIN